MSRCMIDVQKRSHKLVLKLKRTKHRDDEEKWKLERFSASLFTILCTVEVTSSFHPLGKKLSIEQITAYRGNRDGISILSDK